MNESPGFSTQANLDARRFDFFFDRLETCLRKGRGFSLFQADTDCVAAFSEGCARRGLAPQIINLSSLPLRDGSADLASRLASSPFVTLVQDLSYADFLDRADLIADRLVFPLWFRRIPVCFFSGLGR